MHTFRIINSSNGAGANANSYYLGTEVNNNRHADLNAFSGGSKTRENLIGVVTDIHKSFSFNEGAQQMIDALSGIEIAEHGTFILHNDAAGSNQTGSSVFDLDSERDMTALDGFDLYTGKTSSSVTNFQISNLGKGKVNIAASAFDKIKIIQPDDLDYTGSGTYDMIANQVKGSEGGFCFVW